MYLTKNFAYVSGPEFLAKYISAGQHVLAVTGTHGKTTTTSLLTWILHYAGLNPGYLIEWCDQIILGSLPILGGGGNYFVIEGDEYDCAFFDKRSKFIHYHPRTLIINNIEFDHADIFKDLDAILTQFHNLLRTVAGSSLVVYRDDDANIKSLLDKGCWSRKQTFGLNDARFPLPTSILGEHKRLNALAALAAAKKCRCAQKKSH